MRTERKDLRNGVCLGLTAGIAIATLALVHLGVLPVTEQMPLAE
ncbi:hypothetical protein [Mangrovicoccus ximenensis]|nr:hypothetical protein [Mangrovicoccus ximenensis]